MSQVLPGESVVVKKSLQLLAFTVVTVADCGKKFDLF